MCSAFDSMVVMFILYIRNYSPRINEFQSFPHQKFQVHPLSPAAGPAGHKAHNCRYNNVVSVRCKGVRYEI